MRTNERMSYPPRGAKLTRAGEWDWYRTLTFGRRMALRRYMSPTGSCPTVIGAIYCPDDWQAGIAQWLADMDRDAAEQIEPAPLDVMGLAEIAERVRAPLETVHAWARRGKLPEPIARLACGPVWRTDDVETWLCDGASLGAKYRPRRLPELVEF